jgi:two-component system, sensor histidine kinase PdtaS
MRRHPQPQLLPPAHDYTPEIESLRCQLTGLTQQWHGVAPLPLSLAETVEELTSTIEELHAVNAELTKAEQAARDMQQRYQELFEGAPEAYVVTDRHGVIQEANRAAATLFHLDRTQLAGLPLAVLVAQDMRPAFRMQLAWLRNGAEVREWVIRVQPRRCPSVPVVCQVRPARSVDGQLSGFRWLLRDVSAQQQAQEILEQRVRELTYALTATREQAALRGREQHHRLKNHLQVASSLLDWQGQEVQDPRARTILEACQGRLRAIGLLHELLSHAGEGERLRLGPYLQRLALLVFETYGVDRARVPLTIQAETVEVDVQTALSCGLIAHEVLANALQHALPAPQTGTILITLRAAPAGQATLTVRDTGLGFPTVPAMPPEESFGLQLVRALSEQLQGTLLYTHEDGTSVTLTFPI